MAEVMPMIYFSPPFHRHFSNAREYVRRCALIAAFHQAGLNPETGTDEHWNDSHFAGFAEVALTSIHESWTGIDA
jgi:hypothetical protein